MYASTLERLTKALEIDTIVPGHGTLTTGATVATYRRYLGELLTTVRAAIESGLTLEQALAAATLDVSYVAEGSPLRALMAGFHLWNVQRRYLTIKP